MTEDKKAAEGTLVVDVAKAKLSVAKKKPATKAAKPVAKKAEKKADKPSASETRAALKITVLAKENPKRAGSKSFKTFDLYKKAKTIGDFLKVGGTSADLRYDEEAGHIKIG